MEEDDVTEILADLEGKNKAVAYDFLLKPFGIGTKLSKPFTPKKAILRVQQDLIWSSNW